MSGKQYQILDASGHVVGCLWADKVDDAENSLDSSRFYMRGDQIAAVWYGYREFSEGIAGPPMGRAA